jgi:hypothetical protein
MRCGASEIAELVADIACGLDAVARIFFEAATDDAQQIAGKIGSRVGDRGRIVAQNCRGQFGRRFSGEGAAAGAHLVQDNTEGKNVGAMVESAPRDLFGRHVGGRAHDDADLSVSRGEGGVGGVFGAHVFG